MIQFENSSLVQIEYDKIKENKITLDLMDIEHRFINNLYSYLQVPYLKIIKESAKDR